MAHKMTVKEANELVKQCYDLFLACGYDNIFSDVYDLCEDMAKCKKYLNDSLKTNMRILLNFINGLDKVSTNEELSNYFKSMPENFQLTCLIYLDVKVIMVLESFDQDFIIEFPVELPKVTKTVFDIDAFISLFKKYPL